MTRCETLCLRDGVLCENALARWHIVQSLKRWNFEALLSINFSRHLQQHCSWSQSILSGCISFTRPKSATLNKEQLYSAWMQKTKKQKSASYLCLVHVHSTYVTPRTRKKRVALTAIMVTTLCFLINYKHSNVVSFVMYVYVHPFGSYYQYKTLHFHLQKKVIMIIWPKKKQLKKCKKKSPLQRHYD